MQFAAFTGNGDSMNLWPMPPLCEARSRRTATGRGHPDAENGTLDEHGMRQALPYPVARRPKIVCSSLTSSLSRLAHVYALAQSRVRVGLVRD
eukprot:scaffold9336_cov133-Isochrysis_galbana.AAC.10